MINIAVFTCDKYAPIIPKWLTFFYRYWTLPHKLTIVGVTPGSIKRPIALRDMPITAVYLGKDYGCAANILRYLKGQYEPFLMMMDDHVLFEVNNDLLREAEEIVSRDEVGCVRLVPWPGPTLPYIREDSGFNYETDNFGEIDKSLEYAISLQASFWKPATLEDLLDASWNPWQIELEGSKRAATYSKSFVRNKRDILGAPELLGTPYPMRFIGCKVRALNYKDYYMRGGPRPEHAEWVDKNL